MATEPPKKQKNSKKAAAPPEIKVVVAKIQRQKRKFITAIAGLETVPGNSYCESSDLHLTNGRIVLLITLDLRLKDATKVLGKKFSSGASVNETPSGAKEVRHNVFFLTWYSSIVTPLSYRLSFREIFFLMYRSY